MESTKSKMLRRIFAIATVWLFLSHGFAISQTGIVDKQSQFNSLAAEIRSKTLEIQKTSSDLDGLSAEIRQLKNDSHKANFLQKYKLQSRLQEAQFLSEKLASLQTQKQDLNKKLQTSQRSLISMLDQEIDIHRKNVLSKNLSLPTRQESAAKLLRLLQDRFSVISVAYVELRKDPTMLPQLAQDQDELSEQLLAMDDLEKKLSKELEVLQQELVLAKRQKFLQHELAQLFEEEAFFGEQGFIHVGSNKEAAKKDPSAFNALANSQPVKPEEGPTPPAAALPTTTVPNNPTGSVGIPSPSNSTGNTTAPAGSSNTGSTVTSDTNVAATGSLRNGLAYSQDRGKLLRSDQKEGTKSFVESTNLDHQILWLRDQLDQVKNSLGEVKKTKKEIQSILSHP